MMQSYGPPQSAMIRYRLDRGATDGRRDARGQLPLASCSPYVEKFTVATCATRQGALESTGCGNGSLEAGELGLRQYAIL
jgi:hypothetical protein